MAELILMKVSVVIVGMLKICYLFHLNILRGSKDYGILGYGPNKIKTVFFII